MNKGEETTTCSSDDAAAAAAAPLAAGNGGSRSGFARAVPSSVLARAGLVFAEVVRHLHRVHQRGAAAVFVFWEWVFL